jgi:hypothetical protein
MAKLEIEKVGYGIVPYGPGAGTLAVGVYFKEVEGEYTYEKPEDEKKDGTVWTDDEIAAHGLMADMLNLIKEKDIPEEWSKFLLAKHYGYFIGDCIAKAEHRPVTAKFFEMLDSAALAIQLKVIKERVIDPEKQKSEIMKQLAAPMGVLVVGPNNYTGRDDFYQRFRIILCKYPLDDEPNFNPMACVEIGNHNFATGILDFDGDFEKQKKIIEEVYNKEKDRTYYWAKVVGFKLFWVIPIYTTFEVGFADYGGIFWLTKSSLIYDLNKRHQNFKDQIEEEKFVKFSRKNSQLITTNND